MQALLLIAGVLIIVYNLFVNISNLSTLASEALRLNTVNGYWDAYFKSCVSARAIISSIIGMIFAFLLYLALTLIIAFRGEAVKKEIALAKSTGYKFYYENIPSLSEQKKNFHSNVSICGLAETDIMATGIVRLDLAQIMAHIQKECEAKNLTLRYEIMQEIQLGNDTATLPFLFTINNVDYPLYVIYTEEHKKQFSAVSEKLKAAGINDVLYYSLLPIEEPEVIVTDTVEVTPGLV
jgi:hypothetical protein